MEIPTENLATKSSDLSLKLTNTPKSGSSSVLIAPNEDNVLNSITNSKKTDIVISNTALDSKYAFHIISMHPFV